MKDAGTTSTDTQSDGVHNPTGDHEMKLQMVFLRGAVVAALAMGACDSSKPDLEKTRAELSSITADRDGLKAQLEAEKTHEAALAAQVTDLNAKLATAQTAKTGAAKPPEHAQATAMKKDDKAGKKVAQGSSRKKG
jgi:hypothetical protein